MMNKKADERVLSIYLFIIYIIVGIGIVSGVLIFYGESFDVRELEASILADQVIDCFVEQGKLKPMVFLWENLSECNLEFKDHSLEYNGNEEYYVRVKISDLGNTVEKELFQGNNEIFQYCDLKGEEKFVRCARKEIYVLNNTVGKFLEVYSSVGKAK